MTRSTDALAVMREGYNHERRYWNSFHIGLPAVRDIMLATLRHVAANGADVRLDTHRMHYSALEPQFVQAIEDGATCQGAEPGSVHQPESTLSKRNRAPDEDDRSGGVIQRADESGVA